MVKMMMHQLCCSPVLQTLKCDVPSIDLITALLQLSLLLVVLPATLYIATRTSVLQCQLQEL